MEETQVVQKKSVAVGLGLTALVAAGVVSCQHERRYALDTAGYCVDTRTQIRVDDSLCRTPHGGYGWYYVHTGYGYPRIGGRAIGGSFTVPRGSSYVEGGLGRSGGTVDASHVRGGSVHSVKTGGFGHLGGHLGRIG